MRIEIGVDTVPIGIAEILNRGNDFSHRPGFGRVAITVRAIDTAGTFLRVAKCQHHHAVLLPRQIKITFSEGTAFVDDLRAVF